MQKTGGVHQLETANVRKSNGLEQTRRRRYGERLQTFFYKVGLQIKRRESFMAKEPQRKSEKRRVAGTTDTGTAGQKKNGQRGIGELEDYFDSWIRCCDEADVVLEQRRLAEEELKNALTGTGHPESLRRKRQQLSQKRLGSCPRAATQRVRTWNRTWKAL